MPELPEVETVRRGLLPVLEGRVIAHARLARAGLRIPFPAGLEGALTGARVQVLARRAKYILARTDRATTLLLHLGMSGRIAIGPAIGTAHEHLVLETACGTRLALIDPRRFGMVDLIATADEGTDRRLTSLGPEPLGSDFAPASLAAALAGRRLPIKLALLDQRLVAGLGNIYVCEALFEAAINPYRSANSLADAEMARLVAAIRTVLEQAIAAGGSSLRDYVQPSGELGYFQHAWRVYGRAGRPCPRCPGAPACSGVQRVPQGGRSTFYCPHTQR